MSDSAESADRRLRASNHTFCGEPLTRGDRANIVMKTPVGGAQRSGCKLILMILDQYAGGDRDARPSMALIAHHAEMSVRTVRRAIAHLVEIGVVHYEEIGSRHARNYEIYYPRLAEMSGWQPYRPDRDPSRQQSSIGPDCDAEPGQSVTPEPGQIVREPGQIVREPGQIVREPGQFVRAPIRKDPTNDPTTTLRVREARSSSVDRGGGGDAQQAEADPDETGRVTDAPTARLALIRAGVARSTATTLVESWPSLTVELVAAYDRESRSRPGLRNRTGWLVSAIRDRDPLPRATRPGVPADPIKIERQRRAAVIRDEAARAVPPPPGSWRDYLPSTETPAQPARR